MSTPNTTSTENTPSKLLLTSLQTKKSAPPPAVEVNLAQGLSETEAFLLILDE